MVSCGSHDPVSPHGLVEAPREQVPSSENIEVAPVDPLDYLPDTITREQAKSFLSDLNSVRSSSVECQRTHSPVVGPLEWDNSLYAAAFRHNQDMSQNNFVSQVGSDQSQLNGRIENINDYFIFEQLISSNQLNNQVNAPFVDVISKWKLDRRNCLNMMGKAWNKVAISRSVSHTTVVLGAAKPN